MLDELIDRSSFSLHPDCIKEVYYNTDSDFGGQEQVGNSDQAFMDIVILKTLQDLSVDINVRK